MFKNRAFQVRVVKTDDNNTNEPNRPMFPTFSKDDIIDAAGEIFANAGGMAIAVMLVGTVLKTASEIIIHHATK